MFILPGFYGLSGKYHSPYSQSKLENPSELYTIHWQQDKQDLLLQNDAKSSQVSEEALKSMQVTDKKTLSVPSVPLV